MTDKAPEHLYIDLTGEDELGMFVAARYNSYGNMDTKYIRADIHQALEAERDAERAARIKVINERLSGEWRKDLDAEIEQRDAEIQALEAERDELAAALDSKHASVGHNIWRFWSDKAMEVADRNKALQAERDALKALVRKAAYSLWLEQDRREALDYLQSLTEREQTDG